MSGIIQLLPDSIANQIAAGEVIQRPASIVKELLENSIDSGATRITLIIGNAGKALVQVIDDGRGMSPADARMAFERHATSKLRTSADLFNIKTMGFRGEALASIAAISQVDMVTKQEGDTVGSRIVIHGSKFQKQEEVQARAGTSIQVKNLFFNVPARRKFLKSDPVEFRHISEEFQRIALAYPELQMSLFHNEQELYHLPPSNLRQRIVALFTKSSNELIVPLKEETDIVTIEGFVGKPEFGRKTRTNQYLFVNRRYIRSPYLAHAIRSCYENLLKEDVHPFYVLNLTIDPTRIDVNVHPSKHEIKFEDERIMYNLLKVATRHALGQYNITPSIDFDTDNLSVLTRSAGPIPDLSRDQANLANWRKLFEADSGQAPQAGSSTDILHIESDMEGGEERLAALDPIQLHNQYILVPIKSGFLLIDHVAAHERILYEEFLSALERNRSLSQQQLFPQTIELKQSDVPLLKSQIPLMKTLGFELEEFGQNTFILRGMNASIHETTSTVEMIESLVQQLRENKEIRISAEERLARSLARSASMRRKTRLTVLEMKELIDRVFACKTPYISPNGRKCFITFSFEELEKRFLS